VIVLAMVFVAGIMTARKPAPPPPASKGAFPGGSTPASLLKDDGSSKSDYEKPVVERPAHGGEKPSKGSEGKRDEPKNDEKNDEPKKDDNKDEQKQETKGEAPKQEPSTPPPNIEDDQLGDIIKDLKKGD
jgi:hypothetical protein